VVILTVTAVYQQEYWSSKLSNPSVAQWCADLYLRSTSSIRLKSYSIKKCQTVEEGVVVQLALTGSKLNKCVSGGELIESAVNQLKSRSRKVFYGVIRNVVSAIL